MSEDDNPYSQSNAPSGIAPKLSPLAQGCLTALFLVAAFFAIIIAWAVFELATGIYLVGGPEDN